MSLAARLQVNGLPDAARGCVPAPLLADRLLGVVHRVLDPQDNEGGFGFGFERIGNIKLERRVPAFMRADMPAVAPAVGEKIRGPDMKDNPFALPCFVARDIHPAPVPADLITPGGPMI